MSESQLGNAGLGSRGVTAINDKVFDAIYARSLVYNACWEDPAVDRQALNLRPDDQVLVITSAGCNALDYLLTGPRHVFAVDMNPRQNALLELKVAGIRRLQHDDYFKIFGHGWHPEFREIYEDALRPDLGPFPRSFWDRRIKWMSADPGRGLYFHGLSGLVARAWHSYLKLNPRLRDGVEQMEAAADLPEQRHLFDAKVRPHLWSRFLDWILSTQLTMNLLGVPQAQRLEVQAQHHGGVAGFIRDCIDFVFRHIPIWTNYFWRLYINGSYSRDCCPEYLTREGFERLKRGLVDRLSIHTDSVTGFLRTTSHRISRYVLLDHMDWMSTFRRDALVEEWGEVFASASDRARVIFRSAHAWPRYLRDLPAPPDIGPGSLTDYLEFHPELAARLQQKDRVHTYAGFHIADLKA